MSRQYDMIVFDWDGTLVDSTATIVQAIQLASIDAGLPVPPDAQARSIIGLELYAAIRTLFPEVDAEQLQTLVERYRCHFLARDHAVPTFDGVADALADLSARGYWLAIATGKSRRGLERALDKTRLRDFFIASRCADECFSKPHPQMLEELMGELGVMPERAMMVGDTHYDLQMAANAGMEAVAVSYGAQTEEMLLPHRPLATFDHFTKLYQWLIING